jgi:enoyl-CoA hydratase
MDVMIRTEGRAGRITLNRPQALNALTHPMSLAIEAAIDGWARDPAVALIVIDAAGDRAFCAGGDIATIHGQIAAGDLDAPRRFWRDEYRMNAKLGAYPKPVVSLMQGFVMGGGVGIGCHVRHRIVGETARVAMPECGIGLIPDVGGSLLLARAPGASGEYLGLTGARMSAADAIYAGFADRFVPEADWPALIAALCATGQTAAVTEAAETPEASPLAAEQERIGRCFGARALAEILVALEAEGGWGARTRAATDRASPLSLAVTLQAVRTARGLRTLREALALEYRFTFRAPEASDLVEGIRALIIDKDKTPRWRHAGPEAVTEAEVAALLAPLGAEELTFEEIPQ